VEEWDMTSAELVYADNIEAVILLVDKDDQSAPLLRSTFLEVANTLK